MEVYILDSLLRSTRVFDKFESLIWTERWADLGDFELSITSSLDTRSQFIPGTRLATNTSYRVMTVESVEDATDDDGKNVLTVKGHSLETLLNDRIAAKALAATTDAKWIITNKPADVARYIFDQICRLGVLDLDDKIPFLMSGSLFSTGTIPEPQTSVDWEQNTDTVFNAIKAICDKYELGFRLVRNFDTSQLYFDIYAGSDRTTSQTVLPPVIFAPDLDNLQNTTEFTNIENTKNVAYVFSSQGFQVVYADGVDPDIAGFERKVMTVSADDLQPPDGAAASWVPAAAAVTAHLLQAGKDELAKVRGTTLFDGELNQSSNYKYGKDYHLGDLIEMRNQDGVITKRRVTEQIFACDSEGERSYPTLASAVYDSSNSWLYETDEVWSDLAVNDYWSTRP